MTTERIVNNQIADLVSEVEQLNEENERLRKALTEIAQMSYSGSYLDSIVDMKAISSKALKGITKP